jgi:hypothetical protein
MAVHTVYSTVWKDIWQVQCCCPKALVWSSESNAFGGTVLDQFWHQLGSCHPKLKENSKIILFSFRLGSCWYVLVVKSLKVVSERILTDQSIQFVFRGVDRVSVDVTPVLNMAAELFTHLRIACIYSSSIRREHDNQ